jgi:hypothetical protein
MQSSPISPSRFHWNTSRGLAAACAACAACGGGGSSTPDAANCGPGSAPEIGIVASSSAVTLTYGDLSGSLNNDCSTGSMSIEGHQTDGPGRITLCVGHPDQLATASLALGLSLSSPVFVQDLSGDSNSCSLTIDKTQPVSGTASSTGLCDAGHSPAGFALTIDGAVTMTRTCGTTTDSVQLALRGTVAVATPQ